MDSFSRPLTRLSRERSIQSLLTTKKVQPFDRTNGIRLRFYLFEAFPFQGKLGIIEPCVESVLFQKRFMGSLFDDVAVSHHQD